MTAARDGKPVYFSSAIAFRAWLAKHHRTATVLLVGFHKKATGRPTLTWQESVDEALCYGWIDGVRRSVDAERYTIRFTPRRATSRWSAINLARVKVLTAEGRMQAAGLAIHAARRAPEHPGYSYESPKKAVFTPTHERKFRRAKAAWAFFSTQAPSYQRLVMHWVESAKQPTTRGNRLESAIAASAERRRL